MKSLIYLCLAIPFCVYSQSQFNLQGKVYDAETGEPLSYATIIYPKKQIGTSTDDNGNFQLFIPAGLPTDTLKISHVGYVHLTLTIESCINQQHFPLHTSVLEELVVSAKAEKFNAKEFMEETVKAFNNNKNAKTHIAYSHYREQATKDGKNIMYMESLGYSIYMELSQNMAPFSNYKFICENTRCYVSNPLWREYGKNLNSNPQRYVQPSCNGVLRAYRQLESFGLLSPEKIAKYRFKIDSTYVLNSQNVYVIDFSGGIDKGTVHVVGSNNQILYLNYETRGYWSTPFHTRLTAKIQMRFNYIDSVPYFSSGSSIYTRDGLTHKNELTVILQKDADIELDTALYGLINFYDQRPFISYHTEQWEKFANTGILNFGDNLVELSKYDKEFISASGKWFPGRTLEHNSYTFESHGQIKSLIEKFK